MVNFGKVLVLSVFLISVVGAIPLVETSFCADVVETLKINGSVHSSHVYTLCMDTPSLLWRRDDSLSGGFVGTSIFNSTENVVYKVLFDRTRNPINCTIVTPRSPTV